MIESLITSYLSNLDLSSILKKIDKNKVTEQLNNLVQDPTFSDIVSAIENNPDVKNYVVKIIRKIVLDSHSIFDINGSVNVIRDIVANSAKDIIEAWSTYSTSTDNTTSLDVVIGEIVAKHIKDAIDKVANANQKFYDAQYTSEDTSEEEPEKESDSAFCIKLCYNTMLINHDSWTNYRAAGYQMTKKPYLVLKTVIRANRTYYLIASHSRHTKYYVCSDNIDHTY